jgi:hypothetical protein
VPAKAARKDQASAAEGRYRVKGKDYANQLKAADEWHTNSLKTARLRTSSTTSASSIKCVTGLDDAKKQGTLSQDDVEKPLSRWLI